MSIDQNSHSYTSRDGTSCLTLDLSPGRTSRLVVRSDRPCYCTEARLPSVAITLGRGSHTTLYPLKDYWFKLANSHLLWQDEVEEIRGSCNASIFDPKMAKTTKMRIYQTHQTRHSMIGSQDMIVLAAFGRYGTKTLQNCYFGQKRPYFGHFGCQHFFLTKISFRGHLSHMETQLQSKN